MDALTCQNCQHTGKALISPLTGQVAHSTANVARGVCGFDDFAGVHFHSDMIANVRLALEVDPE